MTLVRAVEKKKKYKRDYNYVFRHLISEIAELDAAIHQYERLGGAARHEWLIKNIGNEIIDIIFLACYMADLFKIDLNKIAPERMKNIKIQYGINKNGK